MVSPFFSFAVATKALADSHAFSSGATAELPLQHWRKS
jgi:hypothetical protein